MLPVLSPLIICQALVDILKLFPWLMLSILESLLLRRKALEFPYGRKLMPPTQAEDRPVPGMVKSHGE